MYSINSNIKMLKIPRTTLHPVHPHSLGSLLTHLAVYKADGTPTRLVAGDAILEYHSHVGCACARRWRRTRGHPGPWCNDMEPCHGVLRVVARRGGGRWSDGGYDNLVRAANCALAVICVESQRLYLCVGESTEGSQQAKFEPRSKQADALNGTNISIKCYPIMPI